MIIKRLFFSFSFFHCDRLHLHLLHHIIKNRRTWLHGRVFASHAWEPGVKLYVYSYSLYSLYSGNVNHGSIVKHKKGYKRWVRKHVWVRDWQSRSTFLRISWQGARPAQNVNCADGHSLPVKKKWSWAWNTVLFSHHFENHCKRHLISSHGVLKC